jgi:hypothetical protein
MQNYEELIQELISSHQAVGSKMSLKIHSLYSDLDFFPRAAEGFHQDGPVERSYDKKNTMRSKIKKKIRMAMINTLQLAARKNLIQMSSDVR